MARKVRLGETVGPGLRAEQGDLGQVRWALSRFGIYDPAEDDDAASSGGLTAALHDAIARFQDTQRLSVDGRIRPGGPTEAKLNFVLGVLDEPAMNRGLYDRNGRPIPERIAAFEARQRREATPGMLAGRVGPGLENHPDDLATVRALLEARGYAPTQESNAAASQDLFDGLRRFQRANDLVVDGVIAPDGETEASLITRPNAPNDLVSKAGSLGSRRPIQVRGTAIPLSATHDRKQGFYPIPILPPHDSKVVQDMGRWLQSLFEQGSEELGDLGEWPSSPADPIEPIAPSGYPADPLFDAGVPPSQPSTETLPDREELVPPALPPEFEYIPIPDDALRTEGMIVKRWGGKQTRADLRRARAWVRLKLRDLELVGSRPGIGEVRKKEPWYGPAEPVAGRSPTFGGSYADLGYVDTKNKTLILIQHQTVLADGQTPNSREAEAVKRLRRNAEAAQRDGWKVIIVEVPKRIKYANGSYEDDRAYWNRLDPILRDQFNRHGIKVDGEGKPDDWKYLRDG